jgi:hypothetical protein
MLESFEYKGVWYLPDDPENKIGGMLRFSPEEGISLDLVGSFIRFTLDRNREGHEIILGSTLVGKDVTLTGCYVLSHTHTTNRSLSAQSYQVTRAYVGPHYYSHDEIRFHALQVRYSNLDTWAGISGLNIDHPSSSDEVVIRYIPPVGIKLADLEDRTISLEFHYSAPFPGWGLDVRTQVTLTQEAWIYITFSYDQPWDKCWLAVRQVQQFLSLGVGQAVYLMRVRGLTDAYRIRVDDGKQEYVPVDIYYKQSGDVLTLKDLSAHDMFFVLGDMADEAPEIMGNFISRTELLKPAYDLYFAMLFGSRSYLEPRFLGIMQTLEIYHRLTKSSEELPKAQHRKRKRAILRTTPLEHRHWLSLRLQYSNEISLKTRILRLLEHLPERVRDFIPDEIKFAVKASVTRNYLTHYNAALRAEAAKDEELYYLMEKVRLLFEICLLNELGFSEEAIERVTESKRQWLKRS